MKQKKGKIFQKGILFAIMMLLMSCYFLPVYAAEDIQTLKKTKVVVSQETATSVKLKWKKISQATGYEIYASTKENGTYKKIKTITKGSTRTYVHKNRVCGQTYYYKVRAYQKVDQDGQNIINYAPYSKAVSIQLKPDTTKIQKATPKNYNTIEVTWEKTQGATGYEIYRAVSKNGKYKKIGESTDKKNFSYQDNDSIITGCTYYYKVRAFSGKGKQKTYGAFSKVLSARTVPAKAAIKDVASVNYKTTKITWKKTKGAYGYALYRATSKNGVYTLVGRTQKTSLNDTKVTTGKKYYYKVRAYALYKGKRVYGSYSSIKTGTAVPAATTKIVAKSTDNKEITITWKKVSGATGYEVYRATSKNGTYKRISPKNYKDNAYTDSGLKVGSNYYYKVRAVRKDVYGEYSDTVKGKAVSFELKTTKKTIMRKGTFTIQANVNPQTSIKWESSDPGVASVDAWGTVTANNPGTAVITATAFGMTRSCKVTVKAYYDGVDVSAYQGWVNWNAVKGSGIDFAMLRILTGTNVHNLSVDAQFEANYTGAKNAGLKVGVYRYSYAMSVEEAKLEAYAVLNTLKGRQLQYPVVYDMENPSQLALPRETRTQMISAFKQIIENAGYKFALYANLNWLENYIAMENFADTDVWIARYCDTSLGHRYTGPGNVTMWQYTSSGSVPGISGNVDRDISYKDYQ